MLEPGAYILAIMLAFYRIFRIGKIKALSWDSKDENTVITQHQLVEERALQEDMTLSQPHRVVKDPKGNPHYSIRTECLPAEGVAVLKKMKSLLYDAGVKPINIQPLLGHSTLTMTEHYIGQRVTERDTSQMARVLA